jgi:hypothetical protein
MQWLKGKVNGPDMQLVYIIRWLCARVRLPRSLRSLAMTSLNHRHCERSEAIYLGV